MVVIRDLIIRGNIIFKEVKSMNILSLVVKFYVFVGLFLFFIY